MLINEKNTRPIYFGGIAKELISPKSTNEKVPSPLMSAIMLAALNNTKYPDMVCDYLPDMKGKYVSSLSLAYMNEGAFGDTLTIQRSASENDGYLLRTVRTDGKVCLEAAVTLKNM